MMRLLGILFLLTPAIFGYSRDNGDARYHHYTTEDGLPSSTVFYILQDRKGYMWFSTDAGVSRFDGYSIQNFSYKDGLPDNVIHTMYEDLEGRIWFIGMKWQLSYFQNDSIHLFNPENKLDGLNANDIVHDRNGALWFSFYNGGLYRYQSGKLESYNDVIKGLPIERVGFAQDSSGRYLVSTYRKYGYLDSDGVNYHSLPEKVLSGGDFTRFFVTSSGQAIGRSKIALFEILGDTINSFFPPAGFPGNTIINMVSEGSDGSLLVSTNGGAYQLAKSEKGYKVSKSFLEAEFVNMIKEDREHNLWFSTKSDGVFFLSNTARMITVINAGNGLENEMIYSIAKFFDGTICLGSQNGLIQFLKNGQCRKLSVEKSGIINNVNHLAVDSDDRLWCALDGGVIFLKKEQRSDFKAMPLNSRVEEVFGSRPDKHPFDASVNYFNGGSAKSIAFGGKNDAWIANSVGLFRIKMDEAGNYLFRYGKSRVTDVCVDKEGKVWICNPNGLTYLMSDSTTATGEYFFQNFSISSLETDNNGTLWVATRGSGIYTINEGTIDSISFSDGLSSDNVVSLFMSDNAVWASTVKGLSKIEFRTDVKKPYTISLGKNDGLPSEEINYTFVDGDTVYVATNHGLAIFRQSEVFTAATPPPVYIQSVNINNRDTLPLESFSLQHFQNDIFIVVLGISYKSSGRMKYRYRLEGAEAEWKLADSREINYPMLPPGNYRFQVKAVNEDGVESVSSASIGFAIAPPYWQTTWFRLLVMLASVCVVGAMIYAVVRYYKNKNMLMGRIFEAEQKALRAQMNPHFVFNALYSIQNFITKNDQYSANIYLAKFSDLVRMTLDYSKNVSIPIAEELKFLRTYLELESLRFENKFDYKIVVDSSVDIYKMKILSMLIQPFIENSIKHGLLQKKTKGEIKIGLTKENGYLTCVIEDNGIGREKAMAIKNTKSSAHISQGIAITEERLALLKNGNNTGSISILDLKDAQGNPTGTKVILKIPYSES